MHELQKLLVAQCGSASIMVVIDWEHHLSWWEVCCGKQTERCNNVCEAEYIYEKMKERT